jgi:hypothetical protein
MVAATQAKPKPKGPSLKERWDQFWSGGKSAPQPSGAAPQGPTTQPLPDQLSHIDELIKGLPSDLDEFTKRRIAETVETVDDLTDTAQGPETKMQNGYISTVIVLVPIITAFFLAYETGAFFYGKDFDGASMLSWVQFGVAGLLESVLVAIVFEMAKAKRNGESKQWRTLFAFWFFFVATSYVGQFMYLYAIYLTTHVSVSASGTVAQPSVSPMAWVGVALRCASCCLIDLVCSGYLGRKSKTLEKQVDELTFKSRAIKTLTEAFIALKEAILQSLARQKEEDQRQERRRVEDEQVARLRNMIMEAGLNALSGVNDDNDRGWKI